MQSISSSILRRIRGKQRGWVFTPKNFIDLGPRSLIDTVLHRLLKKGVIRKLGRGIYDFPVKHPKLGNLSANPDTIAKAIAAKTGDTAQPSGARLANQLGLDMQIPAKPSYITSGKTKQKKILNYPIRLTHSKWTANTSLNINVSKVINALHHLGKNSITADTIKKCKKILTDKDKSQIKKQLAKLPDWMIPYILKIIGK